MTATPEPRPNMPEPKSRASIVIAARQRPLDVQSMQRLQTLTGESTHAVCADTPQSVHHQSQLAQIVTAQCPLRLGRFLQPEGPSNVDFKRPVIDQLIQFRERLRI